MLVVPKDFQDWSKPIGTGAFIFGSFNPGVSATAKRNPHYWNPDRGFVDDVTFTCINDTPARMNAIMSGKVDIIDRVDTATIDLLKKVRNIELVMARGGYHAIYAARCDTARCTKKIAAPVETTTSSALATKIRLVSDESTATARCRRRRSLLRPCCRRRW